MSLGPDCLLKMTAWTQKLSPRVELPCVQTPGREGPETWPRQGVFLPSVCEVPEASERDASPRPLSRWDWRSPSDYPGRPQAKCGRPEQEV